MLSLICTIMNNTDKELYGLEILKWYRSLITESDPYSLVVCPKGLDHLLPIIGFDEERGAFYECLECDTRIYPGSARLLAIENRIPDLIILRATTP